LQAGKKVDYATNLFPQKLQELFIRNLGVYATVIFVKPFSSIALLQNRAENNLDRRRRAQRFERRTQARTNIGKANRAS